MILWLARLAVFALAVYGALALWSDIEDLRVPKCPVCGARHRHGPHHHRGPDRERIA